MMNESPWIDATQAIFPGMPVWPGDHPVVEDASTRVANGDASNVSAYTFSSHTGTHIDPPLHFLDGTAAVDDLDLGILCGECLLLDLSTVAGHVTPQDLENTLRGSPGQSRELPPRLLLKTRNSFSDRTVFHEDFAAVTPDAAAWIVERGIRLIGIDGPSIEAFDTPDFSVHHTLLGAGVVALEGLALAHLDPARYEMVCAPLPLRGANGAPARVLLRKP